MRERTCLIAALLAWMLGGVLLGCGLLACGQGTTNTPQPPPAAEPPKAAMPTVATAAPAAAQPTPAPAPVPAATGAPLARQQAVAHRIADMAAQLEAARLLVYAAAAAYDAADEQREQTRRSAIAKLFATEAAQQIVDGCVQLHGAVALRRGHLLEQLYRDVRSLRIYEGASEIQRPIIAREGIGSR